MSGAQCHFMGIATIASTTTWQGSQTNTTLPVLQMKKQINVTFICIPAKNIIYRAFGRNSPRSSCPSSWAAGGEDSQSLLGQFCLLALTPPLSSHSLPNPPGSLNTAVENNAIRHICIDNLNKGNINNITELLENRKRKKPPRSPMTLIKPLLLVLG